MKFMLLCYDNEQAWRDAGPGVQSSAMNDAIAIAHELKASGKYVLASPLQDSLTARSVRVRDGRTMVTNGPFVETREVLGGFYIIDARDMDEAVQIAARHPGQRFGGVEVRPIFELAGLPDT